MNPISHKLGTALAHFLSHRRHDHDSFAFTPTGRLLEVLQPGDVLLVAGDTRISAAIKYLTQSAWSHAALYVGPGHFTDPTHAGDCFVEADIGDGVRSVPAAEYRALPTRICRPVGLTDTDRTSLIQFALARLGHRYDLRNVIDLARYLIPTPPVPARFRRRMLALGSGDPTRAICSTLIAQAFQSIGYPILPTPEIRSVSSVSCPGCVDEILHIRHYSLFTPRDFDVSPYFQIVKPDVVLGFDYKALKWSASGVAAADARRAAPATPQPV